jgi:hypothetical protein
MKAFNCHCATYKQTIETTTLELSTGKTTLERSSVQTTTQAETKATTESLMTTGVSATIASGMSTPVQFLTSS